MSAANCKIPPTTVALQIGSKFIAVDWRVSLDRSGQQQCCPGGKRRDRLCSGQGGSGGFRRERHRQYRHPGWADTILTTGCAGGKRCRAGSGLRLCRRFRLFAKYYPDAPYAEGVVVISSEHFYTDDAEAADAINPVTIHAVALLLARVRETRAYISVELPKAFYDLADPGPDKGKTEGFIREMAGVKVNLDLYPIPPEAEKKEGVPAAPSPR